MEESAFNALAEAVPYDLATIWRLDGEELRKAVDSCAREARS